MAELVEPIQMNLLPENVIVIMQKISVFNWGRRTIMPIIFGINYRKNRVLFKTLAKLRLDRNFNPNREFTRWT